MRNKFISFILLEIILVMISFVISKYCLTNLYIVPLDIKIYVDCLENDNFVVKYEDNKEYISFDSIINKNGDEIEIKNRLRTINDFHIRLYFKKEFEGNNIKKIVVSSFLGEININGDLLFNLFWKKGLKKIKNGTSLKVSEIESSRSFLDSSVREIKDIKYLIKAFNNRNNFYVSLCLLTILGIIMTWMKGNPFCLFKEPRSHLILIYVFLFSLFLPKLNHIFSFYSDIKSTENRNMAKKPNLFNNDLFNNNFQEEYESYFNDNFSFRNLLIHLNSKWHYELFNVSIRDDIYLGKNGWLFLDHNDSITKQYRGLMNPNNKFKKRFYNILKNKEKILKERGIEYRFVIVPNKCTIYGKYLPDEITKVSNEEYTDVLLDGISDKTLIDLRQAFRAKNLNIEYYYKNDTHWNYYGAAIAYKEIMESLKLDNNKLEVLPLSYFKFKKVDFYGGNILGKMSLLDKSFKDTKYIITKDQNYIKRVREKGDDRRRVFRFKNNKINKENKILIIGDSYIRFFREIFSESFSDTICYERFFYFQMKVIDEVKPDVVIEVYSERNLMNKGDVVGKIILRH